MYVLHYDIVYFTAAWRGAAVGLGATVGRVIARRSGRNLTAISCLFVLVASLFVISLF